MKKIYTYIIFKEKHLLTFKNLPPCDFKLPGQSLSPTPPPSTHTHTHKHTHTHTHP